MDINIDTCMDTHYIYCILHHFQISDSIEAQYFAKLVSKNQNNFAEDTRPGLK